MRKIGLITDSVNFPSLPLMKISAYHKKKNNIVKIVDNFLETYDIVYISKVFNLNLPTINPLLYIPRADKIYKGGSGYAIKVLNGFENYETKNDLPLPQEIENIYPDYSLYPQYTNNTAYGYLTRGCPNNCTFCIVCKKDGLISRKVADLKNFWNNQKNIELLDANILACKEREDLFKQLIKSKASICYTQGLDARLINDDIAKMICATKPKMVHFAWDLMKNEEKILKGLKIFSKHYKESYRKKRIYILTNFNTTLYEDYYRVKRVIDLGYSAYVMIYQKGTHPQFLTDLARWTNNACLFNSTSFEEYIPRKDGRKVSILYKDILRGAKC